MRRASVRLLSATDAWFPPTPGLRDWQTQMAERVHGKISLYRDPRRVNRGPAARPQVTTTARCDDGY